MQRPVMFPVPSPCAVPRRLSVAALAALLLAFPAWADPDPLSSGAASDTSDRQIPFPAISPSSSCAGPERTPGLPSAAMPQPPPAPTAVPAVSPDLLASRWSRFPDRWRLVDELGIEGNPFNPYRQSTLKVAIGPSSTIGFINLSAVSDSVVEPRSFPRAGRRRDDGAIRHQLDLRPAGPARHQPSRRSSTTFSLIKGDTTFQPPDLELRLTPVFNYNYTQASRRRGLVNIDPRKGLTRNDGFLFGLAGRLLSTTICATSPARYDFDAVRVGIQPFSSDFRGFLFQDSAAGIRLFGDSAKNRYQNKLAWFRRIEKDTNSGLNDLGQPLRRDDVYAANLYVQDFPVPGFTSQVTAIHNRNHETGLHYDPATGFQVRPASSIGFRGSAPLRGDLSRRQWRRAFPGRINLTVSGYYARGTDRNSTFTDSAEPDISSYFLAAEPSIDLDWARLRLSGAYASGDSDPFSNTEHGFDAILGESAIRRRPMRATGSASRFR